MKDKLIKYAVFGILLLLVVIYVFSGNETEYNEKINDSRKEYELSLRNSSNSPLENKTNFEGLSFFQPNIAYVVDAKVERIKAYKTLELSTNQGSVRFYRYFAYLKFKLNGKDCKLLLLQNAEDETDYFLPFFDLTNGVTTYQGGRYLPIEMQNGPSITLDFNLAFNPYCVYNKKYICPVPPMENKLPIQVEAGEKKKEKYYR